MKAMKAPKAMKAMKAMKAWHVKHPDIIVSYLHELCFFMEFHFDPIF